MTVGYMQLDTLTVTLLYQSLGLLVYYRPVVLLCSRLAA